MKDSGHSEAPERVPLAEPVSRRSALKTLGVMGVAPLVGRGGPTSPGGAVTGTAASRTGEPGRTVRNPHPKLHRLRAGRMLVDFDVSLGTIHAITAQGDPLGTNFLGNQLNTRGVAIGDAHWTGDVVTAVYHPATATERRADGPPPSRWHHETTLGSADTRTVTPGATDFRVSYRGRSSRPEGIRSFSLETRWHVDGSDLVWDVRLANTTGAELEVGDVAFPLRADDDYGIVYRMELPDAEKIGRTAAIQKVIHEQKVLAHSFVAGHSSYALLQRPRGDGPFLLVRCEGDTSFECAYKVEGRFPGDWVGTDLFAVHSWATHQERSWEWNPWVNGHTSLVLQAGEKRSWRLRFSFIDRYPEIRASLVKSGNLGVRVVPGMVVQEDTDVLVEVQCAADLDAIEIHADGVTIKDRRRVRGATLLTLSFTGRGVKTLKLRYGRRRWTNLHLYCVGVAEDLLKARARFMAERQYYVNPDDPYHRNHLFLSFDYRQGKRIDDFEDVWEVGGTGDPGFGDPLFLAEKNATYPDSEQIERLEAYIDDCLFRWIQDRETWEVRASLYWKKRYPSSSGSTYSKKRSQETDRTYGYCFVANIYHAMYRIGKRYDVLRVRTADDYLRMSFETCRKWFTTGRFKHAGLMTGNNAIQILEDLAREGWTKEHDELFGLMKACNDVFVRDPYPYQSEIEIDETGQHQVYFFTRYFGAHGDKASAAKNKEVVRVIKALRGGDQPIWFNYGQDLFAHPDFRGELSCWHSEALNGIPLLSHYEETGDDVALWKGYPGVIAVLQPVLPSGMGFGWFMYKPGVFNWEPERTFEGGIALWGYLRGAKSYVVQDPVFGLVGYGCTIEASGSRIRVMPRDGVKKRVRWMAEGVDVEAHSGEIREATLDLGSGNVSLRMADSTGLVTTVHVTVRGLEPGSYAVEHGGSSSDHDVRGPLELEVPMAEAAQLEIRKA